MNQEPQVQKGISEMSYKKGEKITPLIEVAIYNHYKNNKIMDFSEHVDPKTCTVYSSKEGIAEITEEIENDIRMRGDDISKVKVLENDSISYIIPFMSTVKFVTTESIELSNYKVSWDETGSYIDIIETSN